MSNLAGYAWLTEHYQIYPCQPLRVRSEIGNLRKRVEVDGVTQQIFPAQYRPAPSLAGHLTFAFKREPLHLELLARLFFTLNPHDLLDWIAFEPTGQYARKACFLFEWLSGVALDHPGLDKGNYVALLDEHQYLTSSVSTRNQRWRVLDNLPGTPAFCPLIRLTPSLMQLIDYDAQQALDSLRVEYGQDTLQRSVQWLTVKESQSSFAIEHEAQKLDRIQRFAAVMEVRCGVGLPPLDPLQINALQAEILGPTALAYGVRRSPVFVGQTLGFQNVVNYLAPHWEHALGMLEGLQCFEQKTRGRNALLRAAAISFGFVYIHPLSDGNGRISRFLINDILRRDQVIPVPYILPVSAVMQDQLFAPQNYDQVLEVFSGPLMRAIRPDLYFDQPIQYPDGVESNLRFDDFENTAPAWRYIDMTAHAEYMARVIRQTIDKEMREEASLLRDHYQMREAIKAIIEGPDAQIDNIIRSVQQNKGIISNKLLKQYPALADQQRAAEVVAVVRQFKPWNNVE
jgi:hypothetical protein